MDKNKLIKALNGHPEIEAAILFGSQATENANQESDIDLALLYDSQEIPKPLDLIQFKDELSDLMQQEVDIVLLNDASPIIAMQAVKNGVPLYVSNKKSYQNFEMRLITDYADLKRVRAPFEKEILKRKLHD